MISQEGYISRPENSKKMKLILFKIEILIISSGNSERIKISENFKFHMQVKYQGQTEYESIWEVAG